MDTMTAFTLPATLTPTRILIVEEDVERADRLGVTLARYGFVTEAVHCCSAARDRAGGFDLVLLDIDLPDLGNLGTCGLLVGDRAVIVMSGRDDEGDRVAALELGADDYLTRPFGTRELVARCRAVTRRRRGSAAGGGRALVRAGDLEIDLMRFEVRRDGRPLPLATKEMALLVALARRPGVVVRREELADEVWGCGLWPVNRALDAQMSSLRRKLRQSSQHPACVQTVRGLGFRLVR